MHTLSDMAQALNRPVFYLSGLQARFALPVFPGNGYSESYLAFLRSIIHLRILGVSEETLLKLWQTEKKLLAILHADSTGSSAWFLEQCGQPKHRRRRLLLTNSDLGVQIPSGVLQPGLNFAQAPAELFASGEMGEDGLRLLEETIALSKTLRSVVLSERRIVRKAIQWSNGVARFLPI